jgi:hypothetical protein
MEEKKENSENKSLVHNFNPSNKKMSSSKLTAILFVVVILLGIGSGFLLSKTTSSTNKSGGGNLIKSLGVSKGTTEGSSDTSTFKDTAEGTLRVGGIEDEGAFHLERSGGPSQNVYLTSSIVDLSKYVGKKVKVWGQTQKAQHAGWLMDVGKIEVL